MGDVRDHAVAAIQRRSFATGFRVLRFAAAGHGDPMKRPSGAGRSPAPGASPDAKTVRLPEGLSHRLRV